MLVSNEDATPQQNLKVSAMDVKQAHCKRKLHIFTIARGPFRMCHTRMLHNHSYIQNTLDVTSSIGHKNGSQTHVPMTFPPIGGGKMMTSCDVLGQ